MAFACQRDSFQKELQTSVISCKPSSSNWTDENGVKTKVSGFEVVFADTILFPEGGGQNTDRGTVNGQRILFVSRNGTEAVHFVEATEALEVGKEYLLSVDWKRRFDNMQQHSGQHLISAILERDFNSATTSWWMAETVGAKVGVSYIELDRGLSKEEISLAEETCNRAIREQKTVTVKTFEEGDPELTQANTRGLPDDVHGPVRVICIEDTDLNMCCGTHVSNLAQLQCVCLFQCEKAKKGKFQLNFLVGDRALRYLHRSYDREEKLTGLLKGGPEDHLSLATKCTQNLKVSQKSLQNVLREIAVMEANQINQQKPFPKHVLKWRKEGSFDYVNVLLSNIENKDLFMCVLVGDDREGPSHLTITGTEEDVQKFGPKIINLLEGKGGGKGRRMNAKINKASNWISCVTKLLEDEKTES